MSRNIVIVGAGQAGLSAAAKLRRLDFDGGITLVGAEPVPPYQRPPLSKKYLTGEMSRERLYLKPEDFYGASDIDLRTGVAVTEIDRFNQVVGTDDGGQIPYDDLVLTTGAAPRRLPDRMGGNLPGVFVMRSLQDAEALAPVFAPGRSLLVIGGGYIGLEAAAVAASLGMSVTLIEMADRILQRVAAPETSSFFRELHRGKGVEIIEGIGLDHLTGQSHVTGAVLSDGRRIDADVVVVGIGVAPNTSLAEDAGLPLENGIAVDTYGRTEHPGIWAAGDCASFPYRAGRIRLESVPNAIAHAETVAANLMGANQPYEPDVWFWSDQFDVKLQIAGLNTGFDDVITRPGTREGAVSFWYFRRDQLVAVDAMNDPRSYMTGKRMIERGQTPDKAMVADGSSDLRSAV